jgi:phage-related protein
VRVGEAEIHVVADGNDFDRQMRRMIDDARRRFAAFGRDANRNLGSASSAARSFTSVLGGIVGGLGRVVAGGAALGTTVGLLGAGAAAAVQFAAAVAPAVGAVAALPAAIGIAAAAIATLQVATAGVGEAFSAAASGSAEEFNAAIEGLAPSAQAAAVALREITPQFTALRESVQGAFFTGFDATLRSIAETLVGPLQTGMTAAASGLAGITTRLGEAATSGAGVAFIESTFAALANILANLQEPLGLLFEAFLSLGSSIAIAFGSAETAGAGLGALITRFADFVNSAADSGAAIAWVEGAITVFEQLGAILSPIIGILGSVGQAAAATGGNILGAMGQALGAVDAFLSSAEGMAALTSIFTTLNQVGAIFGQVLSGLFPVIAPLVGQLVSGLVPVLQSLVPLIVQIGALAAPIFLQILDAVLPLIPPLANLAQQILPLVAQVLTLLVTAAAPLLEALTTLLVSILTPLIPALEPILLIFGELAVTLSEILTPVIELIGEILLWLVEEIVIPFVVPIIEFLAELFAGLLTEAVQGFADLFTGAVEGIVAIFEWLGEKWDEQTAAMEIAWMILQDAFETGKNFIVNNVINPVVGFFEDLGGAIGDILGDVRSGWNSAISFFSGIPDRIGSALSGLWSPIWDGFKSAINSVIRGWNNLSFSVPSVDLGPLGTVGGFTISTPNIPYLQTGGFSFDEGLAMLHPNEAILPLESDRGIEALADALARAGEMTAGAGLRGDITVRVYIGDTELTEIIDVQIDEHDDELAHRARTGSGRR